MTLAEAIQALDSAAGENYWHVAKGKTRPDEPLYGAAVYDANNPNGDPLAIGEGDNLADVIHEVALKMGDPAALRREHCDN